jgi:hypothetical protein
VPYNGGAMGTFSSELAPLAGPIAGCPRVYADANVPAGVVAFMRTRLGWDVLSVVEHDDLRRARDLEHYRMAQQLRRTLITLDHDYLDDRRFPATEGSGVLVVSAPDEPGLAKLLLRADRVLFRAVGPGGGPRHGGEREALPLAGRKLLAHPDWEVPAEPPRSGRQGRHRRRRRG